MIFFKSVIKDANLIIRKYSLIKNKELVLDLTNARTKRSKNQRAWTFNCTLSKNRRQCSYIKHLVLNFQIWMQAKELSIRKVINDDQ